MSAVLSSPAKRILLGSIATIIFTAYGPQTSVAAVDQFQSGTTWSDPSAWTNGVPDISSAVLIDHGFLNPVPNLTLDDSIGVQTLSFNTGSDVFSIDANAGSNSTLETLLIGGGGTNALGTADLIDLSNSTTGTINFGTTNGAGVLNVAFVNSGNINIGNASATLNFGANSVLFGANISLSQSGPGTMILAGANTFGGAGNSFTLNGGTLDINNSSALGDAGNVFVINGGKIDNTSLASITTASYAQTWNGSFSFGGTSALNLGTGAVTLTGNRNLIVYGTAPLTIGGVISGSGFGLTKSGNGTLVLTGANTFTGPLTINGGVLATNNLGGLGTAQGMGQGNSIILNGGTFRYTGGNYGATGPAFTPTITVGPNGGTFDTAGGFVFYGGSFAGSGTLTVINSNNTTSAWILYTGASPNFTGNIVIGDGTHTQSGIQYRSTNATPFGTGTITINTGGLLSSDGGGGTIPNNLIMNGGIFGAQGSNTTYSGAITLQSSSSIGSPPITNATGGVITVTGVISGSGGLNKVTADNAILSAANTFTGNTTVSGGTLTLNNAFALQKSTLAYTGAGGNLSFGTLTAATIGALQGNQNLTLQNTSSTAVALSVGYNDSSTTYSGVLSGAGSLVKVGLGTFTLTGASTYAGATTVNNGTLQLDFSSSLNASNIVNSAANNSALTLGGGTLVLTGNANTTNSQQFNKLNVAAGSSSIQINPNATGNTVALNVGAINRSVGGTLDLTLPSSTSAANGLATTSGTGGAILTDSSTGLGSVYATVGGSDWAAKDASNGFIVGLSTLGGYTSSTSTSLTGNADIASGVTATTLSANTAITSLRFNQNQATTISLGSTTLSTQGILVTSQVGGNLSSITSGTLLGAAGDDLVVIQNNTNTQGGLTIGSVIADNSTATGLTKSGAGLLTLTGTNTFSGPVTINGGTLSVASLAKGGAASGLGKGTQIVFNGGTLNYTGGSITTGNFDRAITINSAGGTINLTPTTGYVFLSGVISGTAGGTFTKSGAMQLIVTANNTYNGVTDITAGEVQLRGSTTATTTTSITALGTSSVTVENGADLAVGGGTIGTVANNITLKGTTTGNGALQANDTGTNTIYSGTITLAATSGIGSNTGIAFTISGPVVGSGGLTKLSSNAVTLSGINTFSGDTTVSAGSLVLANTQALQNSTLTTGGVVFSSAVATHAFNFGGLSGTGNITLADNATTPNAVALSVGSNGASKTYSGVLSGAGSLTKVGAGTLTLTGANTYTGSTTIGSGTLALSGSGSLASPAITVSPNSVLDVSGLSSGSLSLASNQTLTAGRTGAFANDIIGNVSSAGTINIAGTNTAGTLTLGGNLTLNGGTIVMDIGASTAIGGGSNDLLSVNGLNLNGSTGITLNYLNGSLTPGTYTLVNYSGALTGNASNLYIVNPVRNLTLNTPGGSNGSITITVGASTAANLTWSGDGTGNVWDSGNTANFLNAGSAGKFYAFDNVTFDDTGSNSPSVVISAPVQPGSVTFNNNSKAYTFTGAGGIGGTGSLTLNGSATVTLATADSFSGGIALNAGQLNVNNASALGTGRLTIAGGNLNNTSGAVITNTGNNPQSWNSDFTFLGSSSLNLGTGAVTMAANRTLTINASTLTVGGAISGPAALTKAGAGTLVLGGSNTYTGNTTVNAGILQIATTANAIPNNTTVTVNPGGTFDLNGLDLNTGFTKPFFVSGTGATGTNGALVNTNTGSESNVGNLTLLGDSTIGQSGNKLNIRGILDGGGFTLTVAASGTLSATTGGNQTDIRLLNGLTNLAAVIVNGALRMEASQNWAGTFTVNSGAILDTAGNETIAGNVNLMSGGMLSTYNSASTWTGAITLAGTSSINANGGTLTLTGNLGGTGGFTKLGANTLQLNGTSNTYGGGTTVSAGTIVAGSTNALGTGGLQMGGGTYTMNGNSTAVANLSSTVTTAVIQNASATPATLSVGSDNTSTTYSSTIVNGTGGGALSLTKSGNGTLTLSGTNTYTGATQINGGSLIVTGSISGSPTYVSAGTLAGTGTTGSVTVNPGSTIMPGTSLTTGTLNTGALTFSGGGTFALEINTSAITSGLANVSGGLSLGLNAPALTLTDLGSNVALASNTAFTFITYTAGGWDGYEFSYNGNLVPNGGYLTSGANTFQLTYNGGANSNNVILTVVPEPGTAINLLGGLGALAGLARFRRRNK